MCCINIQDTNNIVNINRKGELKIMCPVDSKEIKKAIDSFENDDFISSKEIISKEIRKAKNEFIKDKLELKGDIEPTTEEPDKEE